MTGVSASLDRFATGVNLLADSFLHTSLGWLAKLAHYGCDEWLWRTTNNCDGKVNSKSQAA